MTVAEGVFVASATTERGEMIVYRSADGLVWEHGDPIRGQIEEVTTDGVSLFARSFTDDRPALVRSDDLGRTWTELDVPTVAAMDLIGVAGGPSGLALTGVRLDAPTDVGPEEFLIEKDGYGVDMTEDNVLIVVDIATGEALLTLPPDVDPSTVENLLVEEGSTTLLDPDTLEPLVTITDSDWEQAFAEVFGERPEPEFLVGWSADGENWGWQATADAFGANGWVQLAVGDGAVVAMQFAMDSPTVRLFTAQVD
jgi:hypothetical protein